MASPNPESAARRIESFSGYAILTYAKVMPPNSNALRGLPQIAHATATRKSRTPPTKKKPQAGTPFPALRWGRDLRHRARTLRRQQSKRRNPARHTVLLAPTLPATLSRGPEQRGG